MQEKHEEKDLPQLSVEELFVAAQESYEEAQQRALEENKSFTKTEYFRMDKLGVYRLRILPIAPNPDGTSDRRTYEYPVRQLLMELEKPATGNAKPVSMYVTVPRTTDAGYSVDLIDTYRKLAVAEAQEQGDEKLAEKIGGGSFGGGLKFNYGHAMYILDLNERAKGIQLLTLSHSQFKDLYVVTDGKTNMPVGHQQILEAVSAHVLVAEKGVRDFLLENSSEIVVYGSDETLVVKLAERRDVEAWNMYDEIKDYFSIQSPVKRFLQDYPKVSSFRYGREGVIFRGHNQPFPVAFAEISRVERQDDLLHFTLRDGMVIMASLFSDSCYVKLPPHHYSSPGFLC